MGWFIFGLLSAFGVETFIRICSNYERVEKPPQKRVQVSMPWYGWGLAAYSATRKRSRK